MVPAKFWSESFTHYDADYTPISTNNATAQPVPKYVHKPCGASEVFENLIWLITSDKDQSLLLLHQHKQGNNILFEKRVFMIRNLFYFL